MLTNKPKTFCKTCNTETGLSDCRKMIATFLKASFKSTPSKNIVYRQGRNYESIS